jgi:hypothetical protein
MGQAVDFDEGEGLRWKIPVEKTRDDKFAMGGEDAALIWDFKGVRMKMT